MVVGKLVVGKLVVGKVAVGKVVVGKLVIVGSLVRSRVSIFVFSQNKTNPTIAVTNKGNLILS